MVNETILAAGLVTGVALVIRGIVPRRLSASEAVLALSGALPPRRSLIGELYADAVGSMLRRRRVQSWLVPVAPDLCLMGVTAEGFVGSLVKRTGIVVLGMVLWSSGLVLPSPVGPAAAALVTVVGVVSLWARHVRQLRSSADGRRRTLTNVVQGLLTITLVGATTATPINEVAERALDHGQGWAYDLLRRTYQQGTASNLKIYESLGDLADRIDSRSLRLFADTIRSGDREALAVASVSQRTQALQNEIATHIVARAEEHRRTLQLPIAAFAIAVVLTTVGIPLIAGL